MFVDNEPVVNCIKYIKLYTAYEVIQCMCCMQFFPNEVQTFWNTLLIVFWNLNNFAIISQCVLMYFFAIIPMSIGEYNDLINEMHAFLKRILGCLFIKFIQISTEAHWNLYVQCFHLLEIVGIIVIFYKMAGLRIKPKSKV